MISLAQRLYAALTSRGWLVATLLLASTAFMGVGMSRLHFDNSYEIWFVEGDPAMRSYDEFLDIFGSDETLVVLTEASSGDPFDTEELRVVERLSERIAGMDGVVDVWSLTHMESMLDAGGALEIGRLIPQIPPDAETLERARRLVRGNPLYRALVSADGKSSAIVAHLEHTEGSFEPKARLVRELRAAVEEVVASTPPTRRFGWPAAQSSTKRSTDTRSRTLEPTPPTWAG